MQKYDNLLWALLRFVACNAIRTCTQKHTCSIIYIYIHEQTYAKNDTTVSGFISSLLLSRSRLPAWFKTRIAHHFAAKSANYPKHGVRKNENWHNVGRLTMAWEVHYSRLTLLIGFFQVMCKTISRCSLSLFVRNAIKWRNMMNNFFIIMFLLYIYVLMCIIRLYII